MKTLSVLLTFSTLLLGSVMPVYATLWDRGGGLIYDDAQGTTGITWLQNANLAMSETFDVAGIPSSGLMPRSTADSYIDEMNAANYLGYNDWRLPDTQNPGGFGLIPGELYNLYIGLGNTPGVGGNDQGTDPVIMSFTDGNGDQVDFDNFVNSRYFYSEPYTNGAQNFFHFYYGKQYAYWGPAGAGDINAAGYVWPVRTGDVSIVPVPAAIWLFGSGLLGLIGIARRRKSA